MRLRYVLVLLLLIFGLPLFWIGQIVANGIADRFIMARVSDDLRSKAFIWTAFSLDQSLQPAGRVNFGTLADPSVQIRRFLEGSGMILPTDFDILFQTKAEAIWRA